MSGLYRDEGVVLRTYQLGEADRIVVLLTAGHGKVRAVAKGVRKTKSRFGGRLEPTSHVSLLLYEGRELDIISQAETIDHFRPIREDLDRLTDAMALLEAVDQVAQERRAQPAPLPDARRRPARPWPSAELAAAGRRLLLEAARPRRAPVPLLEQCARCGASAAIGRAGAPSTSAEGGALCRSCRQGPCPRARRLCAC